MGGSQWRDGRKTASPRELLRLLSYVKPYRKQLGLALLSLLAAAGLNLAFPQLVRILIDAAFVERNSDKLNRAVIFLVGTFGGLALFSFLRSYLLSYIGEKVVADLRTQLYSHLLELPVSFFANRRIGEISSRLSSDVGVVQGVTTGTIAELLRQSLTLVGGLAIIAVMNPRLTLLMMAIVPAVILSAVVYGRYIRRMSASVQDRLAEANSALQEALSAIRMVQSFVREDYERWRYRQKIQEGLQTALRRAAAMGGFVAFLIFLVFSGLAVVLWYGGRMVIAGKLGAGSLTAFILYTFFVAFAIMGLAELYGQFQRALGAAGRVFELLDTGSDIRDPENARPLAPVMGHVQIQEVYFVYPDERRSEVLKGVTINARPGEIIALVGPSGSGKSTLVSLIPRFYDVVSGAVLVDGWDVRRLRLRELREAIAMVPQETILFSGTIRENIAYGRLGATTDAIEAAARAAHAHEFITELASGYETLVGERGVKLSGGQRQRVAIARAVLKNPAILILDEATSSLDSESEMLVQEALETLMQGRTTFVIAHRLSTVRRADRIIVLAEGRIVEEGTHKELLARNGLYQQLYASQFRDYAWPAAATSPADS